MKLKRDNVSTGHGTGVSDEKTVNGPPPRRGGVTRRAGWRGRALAATLKDKQALADELKAERDRKHEIARKLREREGRTLVQEIVARLKKLVGRGERDSR